MNVNELRKHKHEADIHCLFCLLWGQDMENIEGSAEVLMDWRTLTGHDASTSKDSESSQHNQ